MHVRNSQAGQQILIFIPFSYFFRSQPQITFFPSQCILDKLLKITSHLHNCLSRLRNFILMPEQDATHSHLKISLHCPRLILSKKGERIDEKYSRRPFVPLLIHSSSLLNYLKMTMVKWTN